MFTTARFRCVLALAALLSSSAAARAQCPSWDPILAQNGVPPPGANNSAIYSAAGFDDGSGPALYVAGPFTSIGGVPALNAARWNGTAWSQVGAGLPSSGQYCFDLLAYDDGTGPALYATAWSGTGTPNAVSRWDGVSWSSVGNLAGYARDLLVFDDGTGPALYACGWYSLPTGHPFGHVSRWNGTTWSEVGIRFNYGVYCIAAYDDGSGPALYAGGDFTMSGVTSTPSLARWNGSSWQPLPNSSFFFGNGAGTMTAFDDGSGPALFVSNGQGVHRFQNSTWSTFTSLGAFDFGVFNDGFGDALYAGAGGIDRWNGSGWTHISSGFVVYDLEVFDDGSDGTPDLYLGGTFTSMGGLASQGIAELHGCTVAVPYCAGDSSGSACPCGNFGAPRHGCAHSVSTEGALLSAQGSAVLAHDTLTLIGSSMPNGGVLYFQSGAFSGSGVPFGDGLLCMSSPLIRLATKLNVGGSSRYPEFADAPISITGAVTAPGIRTYQALYRDAAAYCTPATNNLTQALRVTWSP